MSVNAKEEQFEQIELFGKPALFTNCRIDRSSVPEAFYCYDLRGSDSEPGKPVTVENNVKDNHAGTILTAAPITMQKDKDYCRIDSKLNVLGKCIGLEEFCMGL